MNEEVNIDFNANVAPFSASVAQAIDSMKQFNASSEGVLGSIAKLNNISLKLVTSTMSLTGAHKVAVSQAAAYESKLASINATVKISEKQYDGLAKTTAKFARDFPIGMDKAVQTVQTLQKSGVNTTKEIERLGKTFIQLQAASGEWGDGLITDMLQVTRSFGNSTKHMDGFADSLVKVTTKYGASAASVANFSKAIAPVASIVGISQTSVFGLSTAFSRLGEDGYRSANAFNKVLIDMSSSIRDGSPAIKEYANVLNMSQESLTEMFKNDPTETVIKFTEAINKQGPASIRTLNNLGFEGINTFKSLQTLAKSTDLRAMLEDSNKAFGDNSAKEAAKEALGGVNEEMDRLSESMQQTFAQAGTPFLKMLSSVVHAANSVAEAINKIASSPITKFLVGVLAVASPLLKVFLAMQTISFARLLTGLGPGGVTTTGFQQGRAMPQLAPGASLSGAFASARATQGTIRGAIGQVVGQSGLASGISRAASLSPMNMLRGAGRMAIWGGTAAANINSNWFNFKPDDARARTVAGEQLSQSLKANTAQFGSTDYFKNVGKALTTFGKEISSASSTMGGFAKGVQGMMSNFVRATGAHITALGPALRGLVAGVSSAAMGIMRALGPMIAISAIFMGISKIMEWNKKSNEYAKASADGFKDANENYNAFAEKAGLATRSLVSLAEAAKKTTAAINKQNDTQKEALTLTQEEINNAKNPSYEPTMKISSARSERQVADQIRMLLGKNATPEAVATALGDVVNQKDAVFAQNVANIYGTQADQERVQGSTYDIGLRNVASQYGLFDRETENSKNASKDLSGELARNVDSAIKVYGAEATGAATIKEFKDLFDAAQRGGANERKAATNLFKAYTGAKNVYIDQTGGQSFDQFMSQFTGAGVDQKAQGFYETYQNVLKAQAKNPNMPSYATPAADDWQGQANLDLKKKADAVNLIDLEYFGGVTQREKDVKSMSNTIAAAEGMDKASKAATALADALLSGERAARKNATTITDMDDKTKKSLTPLEKAMVEVQQAPDSVVKTVKAGEELAKVTMKNSKNSATAIAELEAQRSKTGISSGERNAINQAIAQVQRNSIVNDAGKSMMTRNKEAIQAARIAYAQGPADNADDEKDRQAKLTAGEEAYAQQLSMAKQFLEAKKKLDLQLQRQNEDAARNEFRARRDFNIQYQQQQEDFEKNLRRQGQDLAKTIYSPFQRITTAKTTDAYSMTRNLQQQNRAIANQMKNIARLKKLGLTQEAVDMLDLMNPQNAQQTERLLADMSRNGGLVAETNRASAERNKLTSKYVRSEDNVATRRVTEDFTLSMTRAKNAMEKGFRDMYADLKIGKDRALEDLLLMGDEVEVSGKDIAQRFGDAMSTIPDSIKPKMSQNMKELVNAMSIDFDAAFGGKFDKFGIKSGDLGTKWAVTTTPAGDTGGKGGLGFGGAGGASISIVPMMHQLGSGEATKYATGGKGSFSAPWKMKGDWIDGYHHGHDIAAPSGTPLYSTVLGKVLHMGGNGPESGWAGNYVELEMLNGMHLMFAHMSSVDKTLETQFKKDSKDGKDTYINRGQQIGAVGSTGRSTGPHVHIEARTKPFGDSNAVDPRKYMATGGIVQQATKAVIGESGAEAVIPLNPRGAAVLADAMVRYVNSTDVLYSRMAPYASNTTHYNSSQYDQSTQINGPITVQTNDPNEFARKMQARQRRQRLLQPIGN